MKKIFLFIVSLFLILILLPSLIVLFLSKNEGEPKRLSSPSVTVLFADTGQVETVDLEKYLTGVVAAEMPASFHAEALKSQAVAARTYIYNHMVTDTQNAEHPKAAVCTDSSHCKAWISEEKMHTELGETWYDTYYEKIQSAVKSTHGEILTYNDEPIVAVFHSTGSGRTESSKDVWGGDLPYLQSVESAGDTSSPKFSSTVEVSKETVCSTLGIRDAAIGEYMRSEGGSVLSVLLGGVPFRGTDLRARFGLNSANFTIEETADTFIFHVKGNGHGVGLSQYGANSMAENGHTYTEILTTYYTDVVLEKKW